MDILPSKTILQWTSKVQYKKSTPYVSLIKHLARQHALAKGNELICKLMMINGKLKVVIDID